MSHRRPSAAPTAPAAHQAAAQGLWQLARDEPWPRATGRQTNDCLTFQLHGDELRLRLLALHAAEWQSADGFYLLAARWQGRLLQYLPPFGDWADLARFERGRYVDAGSGRRRLFERITPDQVLPFNRAILNPRPRHDYRMGPDGRLR